jgi:hypothetical protein
MTGPLNLIIVKLKSSRARVNLAETVKDGSKVFATWFVNPSWHVLSPSRRKTAFVASCDERLWIPSLQRGHGLT